MPIGRMCHALMRSSQALQLLQAHAQAMGRICRATNRSHLRLHQQRHHVIRRLGMCLTRGRRRRRFSESVQVQVIGGRASQVRLR